MNRRRDAATMSPTTLICTGGFGRATARHFATLCPGAIVIDPDECGRAVADAIAGAVYVIGVAWRPSVRLFAFIDQHSRQNQKCFIPLVLDNHLLRLGPVSRPNREGCWNCAVQRQLQHDPEASHRAALWRYYDEEPLAGPRGFLESLALLGAAQLARTLRSLELGEDAPSTVLEYDMLLRRSSVHPVAGVHDCPYCGLNRVSETSSIDELRHALEYLWRDSAG
jgi:bacteriocin biosynthesis cyclodehydratase domain-containing protein